MTGKKLASVSGTTEPSHVVRRAAEFEEHKEQIRLFSRSFRSDVRTLGRPPAESPQRDTAA